MYYVFYYYHILLLIPYQPNLKKKGSKKIKNVTERNTYADILITVHFLM